MAKLIWFQYQNVPDLKRSFFCNMTTLGFIWDFVSKFLTVGFAMN